MIWPRRYRTQCVGIMTDAEFLEWIWARLNKVYGEYENVDYMHRLREIADEVRTVEVPKKIQATAERVGWPL